MTRMLPWRILLQLLQPKQRLLLKLRLNLPKNPRKLLKLFNQLRLKHQLITKVKYFELFIYIFSSLFDYLQLIMYEALLK